MSGVAQSSLPIKRERQRMDPSLLKQKEAFKKRALEASVSQPRPRKETQKKSQTQSKAKKTSKVQSTPQLPPVPKSTAESSRGVNNPYRLLKSVMDMLKERYTSKNYASLSFNEILKEINREDITVELTQWLVEALRSNPKVHFNAENETYLFKPTLGLGVRNRKQLLELLQEWDREGRGGLPMSDVREAVYKPDRAVKKLDEEGLLLRVTRSDKEEIIFYNNREYMLPTPLSEDFRSLWHRVSVDGLTETDIEKYLERVGLAAMSGESSERKRKAPSQQRQPRKRAKNVKILNTHLDSELFSDDSKTQS